VGGALRQPGAPGCRRRTREAAPPGTAVSKRHAGSCSRFLDADDLWVRDKLTWQVEALAVESRPEMVFGMVQQFVSPEIPEESKHRLSYSPEPMAGHVAERCWRGGECSSAPASSTPG